MTPPHHQQCHNISSYIQDLTSSYIDKSHESTVLASSVFTLVLAATFFNFNLFSRVSDISAVLNPTARLLLSSALSLFLPVMSYLFSEAKNSSTTAASDAGAAPADNVRGGGGGSGSEDLPLRARLILMWMLLVELLRKKVEEIISTAGMQAYSSIISHATSVVWLGNLVFFNLKGVGRKALFGILWLLCAVKVIQRAAIAELAKRSFAYGKNARLASSYMAQLLLEQQQAGKAANGSERLKMCKYVVMGEENLVLKEGPHGYKLDVNKVNSDEDNDVVTVGRIWNLINLKDHRRLCFSFALFKLFRPRLEHLPAMKNKEETSNCRDLIFEGLCKEEEEEEGVNNDEVLFQVIHDEVSFLSEYYHSVLPVVLASPYFFLVNYLAVPIVVFQLCLMIIALCGEGNILLAFRRINSDNFALSSGIVTLTRCLWKHFWSSPSAFSSIIDISISYLLFIAVIYEEVWEFIIFVLSNWFMVSLLCTYAAKLRRRESPTIIGWVIRRISWARKYLTSHSRNIITMKQFSVLSFSWLSITLPTQPLPKKAKSSIVRRLRLAPASDHEHTADNNNRAATVPLSNGQSVLNRMNCSHLAWFCSSDSIAEVILIWHIATTLLETTMALAPHKNRAQAGASSSTRPPRSHHNKEVAMGLSKYCTYIVAFMPELLPDDHEGTERVFKDMKNDLKQALGSWGYYFSLNTARYKKLVTLNPNKLKPNLRDEAMTVIEKGIVLMEELKMYVVTPGNNEGLLWRLLADLWVELLVYIAPPCGDEHLIAHEKALVQTGELITLLWVLTTHTGITRPPSVTGTMIQLDVVDVEEGGSTRSY